jgi:hypothetical protein
MRNEGMGDRMAAVAWHDASGGCIRVYVATGGRIDEYVHQGGWRRGPFAADGATSVAAIAVRDNGGHIHHHVFTSDGTAVRHQLWGNDKWNDGPFPATGGTVAAATAFVSAADRLIMRVYVRDAAGGVTEHCWDGGPSWYPGSYTAAGAVANGLTAVSWREAFRLYRATGAKVDERAWHYSWRDGKSFDASKALAATTWQRAPDKPEIALYLGDGGTIKEWWSNGSDWWTGDFPQTGGVDAASTNYFDVSGKLHIRTYVLGENGTVHEHQWDEGSGWKVGVTLHTPWWQIDDGKLKRGPDSFVIKGMCYSRTLIGEPDLKQEKEGPDDSVPSQADVWRADLDAMRAMGVNTIRIYGMTRGVDAYEPFLNEAWHDGNQPIHVILSLWIEPLLLGLRTNVTTPEMQRQLELWRDAVKNSSADPGAALEQLRQNYVTLVQTYASHPAVMGFSIGAEVNNTNRHKSGNGFESLAHTNEFWDDFMSIAAAIRGLALGRILTTGLIDGTMDAKWTGTTAAGAQYVAIGQPLPGGDGHVVCAGLRLGLDAEKRLAGSSSLIDVWGIDVYKTADKFAGLFTLYRNAFATLERPFRPLLVAEFGYPASERNGGEEKQSTYLKAVWEAITAQPNIICGGCVFEWADEWWKGGDRSSHNLGSDELFSGVWRDEEWFGVNALGGSDGATLIGRDARTNLWPSS